MSRDPVCGMIVDASRAAGQSVFDGRTYHFCCPECRRLFDVEPARFASTKPELGRVPCCGFGSGIVRHTSQRGLA